MKTLKAKDAQDRSLDRASAKKPLDPSSRRAVDIDGLRGLFDFDSRWFADLDSEVDAVLAAFPEVREARHPRVGAG